MENEKWTIENYRQRGIHETTLAGMHAPVPVSSSLSIFHFQFSIDFLVWYGQKL
jgi:hypothetical protein